MSIKYSDSGFLDGADETKKLSFDVSGVTTGTTRTITMPDANVDLSSVGTPDDNSVTLAKMAHGTDGELITYDATGAPANVAVGTSGQVLTSGGAGVAPTFQTAAGGATDIDGLSDGTTSGTNNVGLGSSALGSTTGNNNTAVGINALRSGGSNTHNNTAIGHDAMYSSTGEQYSTAVGRWTLRAATTGSSNCAFGHSALYRSTSSTHNNAFGGESLFYTLTGSANAAFGTASLRYNTGGDNSALGAYAGYYNTTGNDNTFLGESCNGSSVTASNEFTLGNSAVSNLRCNDTSISSLSDERDKTNITDLPDSAGLDLINALRPVTYNWDRREWYEDGVTDGSKVMPTYRSWKPNSGLKQGFIAQEVEAAISGEKCLEDSQVVNGTEDKKEFAPQHLLTNAIKAIQQLSAEVETLKAKVATLEGV